MSEFAAFFVSPHLVDMVLALTLVEAVALTIFQRFRAGSLPLVRVWLMLLPGVFLMLALRAGLAGAAWPWIPAALVAALITHLLDLRERLRG
jgi:hypothetical protein